MDTNTSTDRNAVTRTDKQPPTKMTMTTTMMQKQAHRRVPRLLITPPYH